MLNVDARQLAADFADQYRFARVSAIFDGSLLAENQMRLDHMENAIRHIEKEAVGFLSRRNRLRQEEIVEEIEVLLLSAGGPATEGRAEEEQ